MLGYRLTDRHTSERHANGDSRRAAWEPRKDISLRAAIDNAILGNGRQNCNGELEYKRT